MLNFRSVNKLTCLTSLFHWRQISKDMQGNNLTELKDKFWRINCKFWLKFHRLSLACTAPSDCCQWSLNTNWTSRQPLGTNTWVVCWVVAFFTPNITHCILHYTVRSRVLCLHNWQEPPAPAKTYELFLVFALYTHAFCCIF